jgi:hypothetical protein
MIASYNYKSISISLFTILNRDCPSSATGLGAQHAYKYAGTVPEFFPSLLVSVSVAHGELQRVGGGEQRGSASVKFM